MSRDLDYLIVGVDISKEDLDKRLKQAEERITQSSNADGRFEAYLEKGQILQKLERYDESKEPLEEAKKLNPKSPELLIRLGNVYDEEKDFNNAISYYEEGLRYCCDPYAYGHCMLGLARFHWACSHPANLYNKKFSERDYYSDYKEAIDIDKKCFLAYKLKGYVYYHEKEYDKAIESYNKAIEIKKGKRDFTAYHALGEIYAANGEYDKAIENYQKSSYYKYNDEIIEKIDIEDLSKNTDKYQDFPYYFKEFISDLVRFNITINDDYIKLLGALYALWHLSSLDNRDKNVNNSYIYRYIDLEALNKTIENRSLRLSPANYKNDPKEGRAFFEKIERYIKKEKKDNKNDVLKWLAKIKSKSINDNIVTYICCFSGTHDYIPMWYSPYGHNGEGCAIGIDRAKIRKTVLKKQVKKTFPKQPYGNQAELYRVIYVEYKNSPDTETPGESGIITADNLLKGIADCLQSIFDSDEFKSDGGKREHIIKALAKLFSQIAHMMKYNDYEIENEYRLIYTAQITDVRNYIYNDDINDGIYLYTKPILFSQNPVGTRRDEVLLGPVVEKIKYLNIKHQIKSRNYVADVEHSKVPYRKA